MVKAIKLKKEKYYFRAHLHPNNSIDEEQHKDQQGNVRQRLEGLDKRPEQGPDAFTSGQQFHQPHHTEEAEEIYRRN